VQYLSHSASFHSLEKYAPPNAGTKHLNQLQRLQQLRPARALRHVSLILDL
jgi:hypothetical protein